MGLLGRWRRERRRAEVYRDALVLLYWREPLELERRRRTFSDDVLAGAELENLEVHRIAAAALARGDAA